MSFQAGHGEDPVYCGAENMTLIDPVKLEKMMLAKRIGRFLAGSRDEFERQSVEDAAKTLAADQSESVREVLAFELRRSPTLDLDLALTIAFDSEAVAPSFLSVTSAFSDEKMAEIIPRLEEYGRVAIAKRSVIGELSTLSLASSGAEPSITTLVRNDNLILDPSAYGPIMQRFGDNTRLMDHMAGRSDLPSEVIEQLVDKVSDHNKSTVLRKIAHSTFDVTTDKGSAVDLDTVFNDVQTASPQQIHATVTNMRAQGSINMLVVMEMAQRGVHQFLESALALEAGLPLARVREIFTLSQPSDFVRLLQMANVSKTMAPRVLGFVKKHYATEAEAV